MKSTSQESPLLVPNSITSPVCLMNYTFIETYVPQPRLVLDTLAPVPKERKCFRLINGVLVERTVGDVVPALETTAEGLKKVLEGLVKDYKKKQEDMETWKVFLFTGSAVVNNYYH